MHRVFAIHILEQPLKNCKNERNTLTCYRSWSSYQKIRVIFQPESTHWKPSKKSDKASRGNILATYAITSSSLLYSFPHTKRTKIVVVAIINPTEMATTTITYKANRAPCGRPAPSSFETLVLKNKLRSSLSARWRILMILIRSCENNVLTYLIAAPSPTETMYTIQQVLRLKRISKNLCNGSYRSFLVRRSKISNELDVNRTRTLLIILMSLI